MMYLPPIDGALMAGPGIATTAVPALHGLDCGVRIPRKKRAEKLTPGQAQSILGISKAVKMHFVPQMLLAVAMEQMTLFINHCIENRIQEFKKHTRTLKSLLSKYIERLELAYGPAFKAYSHYVDLFLEYTETDRAKMWYSIGNVVNRQIPATIDRDAATHIAIIHHLLDYVAKYDRWADKEIEKNLKRRIRRDQDGILMLMEAMCVEFEETYGFKVEPDEMIDRNMGVLKNRAARLAEELIATEKSQ